MPRGQLRIYLGAAPGVGKTYAMLQEGHRRRERGADVVIGVVETHGRPSTIEQIGDLEVVPRRHLTYRGAELEEMDVDAIIERAPRICLVDELAHTNVPGSRTAKRYEDVELLLDAGIDVISTVNIQHLESLNDVVEAITGVRQRETVPDTVVRAADQIELVDMSPESLRRRLAHGNVYAPEKVDAALANYFRVGNLTALRELASGEADWRGADRAAASASAEELAPLARKLLRPQPLRPPVTDTPPAADVAPVARTLSAAAPAASASPAAAAAATSPSGRRRRGAAAPPATAPAAPSPAAPAPAKPAPRRRKPTSGGT